MSKTTRVYVGEPVRGRADSTRSDAAKRATVQRRAERNTKRQLATVGGAR